MFSQVLIRGRVAIAPMVGDGPSGNLVAFLLAEDGRDGTAAGVRPAAGLSECEIFCRGALADHALACVVEGETVAVTGSLHTSQPPGLEGSDLYVLSVEAESIDCG